MKDNYTASEIARKFNVSHRTVVRWASMNNVYFTGIGKRKTYVFSNGDVQRFQNRRTVGRPSSSKGHKDV